MIKTTTLTITPDEHLDILRRWFRERNCVKGTIEIRPDGTVAFRTEPTMAPITESAQCVNEDAK